MFKSAAYDQLLGLITTYKKFLPIWSFPFLPLGIAAVFQTMAWLSGPILFKNFTLLPRLFILWFMALGEYTAMSPTTHSLNFFMNED